MEDPQRLPADEMQRRAEEAMEEMLLAQEDSDDELMVEETALQQAEFEEVFHDDEQNEDENIHDGMGFLDDDDDEEEDFANNNNNNMPNQHMNFREADDKQSPFPYVKVSLWAAIALIYYAYRTRQQWYLALVFLSSSKYAFVILGNAFVALLVWGFTSLTGLFLNGLRRNEAEGLGDYFRWHITETCLALTIFRSELTVKTALLFLILVFAKCLHHIVDAREAHLRLTEEVVIANQHGNMSIRMPHAKLFCLVTILQVVDIWAVVLCGQDIFKRGPSVSILFAFESAIMLTSVISNALLWHLHLFDGIFQYLHEQQHAQQQQADQPQQPTFWQRWIHPWKDHKATLVFCVELQAQAARFIFYLTFFSIVFCYYGLPINLIREVYVSFLALKSRVQAFQKYRKLLSSMNRFENPTAEELQEEHICIICRDEMTVETAKRLPGCGHIFHKSCLREWLVQQQTCPTCRGDITAMEARQKQQNAMDARILEQQQHQAEGEAEQQDTNMEQEQEDIAEAEDDDEGDSDEAPDNHRLNENPKPEEAKEIVQPTKIETDHHKSRTSMLTKPGSIALSPAKAQESAAFPAFYRTVRSASVYRDEKEGAALYLVTRVVPPAVVVLGTSIEYRTCVLQTKLMVRMPDGWIHEDELQRIVAVPLESLQ